MAHVWVRAGTAAALGVVTLVGLAAPADAGPRAPGAPHRGAAGWIHEDLASADTVGAVFDGGALRVDRRRRAPLAASLRGAAPIPAALATFPPHELAEPTVALDVAVETTGDAATLVVEARGVRGDETWTEWRRTAPARTGNGGRVRLPAAVGRAQVRVGIGPADVAEGTTLEAVRMRPVAAAGDAGAREDPTEPADPFSARLFATRIGQVGALTANGHTIRAADHFVALPSRRGLGQRGGGDYTVRVCTDREEPRCVYAPVWDVGPWNITDDHWNADRQDWTDLPHGTPQAQAAFLEGYNGGLDGFGRRVRNPAGIDLADGVFNEGLRLPTNAWVRVDYLWTGRYAHPAEVAAGDGADPVPVRPGPHADLPDNGMAAPHARVDVACRTTGDEVTGPGGTSDVWYRIGERNHVPAVFVTGGADAPACATAGPGEG